MTGPDAPEQRTGRPVVVLLGPPGSGKSTVARALGSLTGLPVRDTDQDVEATTRTSISDLFVDHGEDHFRALEREAVATALAEHPGVLALGGGAVLDPSTQALLEEYREQGGLVVFLDVSLSQAAPRVGFNQSRPLLLGNPRAQWQALMTARRPVYERLASVHVLTDGLTPAAVAERVVASLGAGRVAGSPRGAAGTDDHAGGRP